MRMNYEEHVRNAGGATDRRMERSLQTDQNNNNNKTTSPTTTSVPSCLTTTAAAAGRNIMTFRRPLHAVISSSTSSSSSNATSRGHHVMVATIVQINNDNNNNNDDNGGGGGGGGSEHHNTTSDGLLSVALAPDAGHHDDLGGVVNFTVGWRHHSSGGGAATVRNSDLLDPHWQSFDALPYAFHVCVGVFIIFTAVFSIVGNGLVLWSAFRFRSLRTSSNLFIISLAFADILMSCVDFPLFAVASFVGHWPFGFHMCQVYGATTGIAGIVTIHTLAAISYDRYTVMVQRAVPMHQISKNITVLTIVFIWCFSTLWVTLPLAGWSYFTLEGIGTSCSFDYLTRTVKNVLYVLALMLVNFVFPLVLIMYSYARILKAVSSVQRGLMDYSPQIARGTQTLRFRRQTEVKAATSIFMIVCFFCVAWTPYVIVTLIGLFGDSSIVTPLVSAIPCIFAKVATVSNPSLYSIGNPKFRAKISYLVKSAFMMRSRANVSGALSTENNLQRSSL